MANGGGGAEGVRLLCPEGQAAGRRAAGRAPALICYFSKSVPHTRAKRLAAISRCLSPLSSLMQSLSLAPRPAPVPRADARPRASTLVRAHHANEESASLAPLKQTAVAALAAAAVLACGFAPAALADAYNDVSLKIKAPFYNER